MPNERRGIQDSVLISSAVSAGIVLSETFEAARFLVVRLLERADVAGLSSATGTGVGSGGGLIASAAAFMKADTASAA